MPLAVSMIHRALEQGLKITVEAYPYGAASTAIGAKFLDPENLSRIGMSYESVEYQGKRLNESSFNELRAKNPGAIVVVHFYELPRDQKLLDMAVLFPGGTSLQTPCRGSVQGRAGNRSERMAAAG